MDRQAGLVSDSAETDFSSSHGGEGRGVANRSRIPSRLLQRRLAKSDAPGSRDRDYLVYVPERPVVRRVSSRPAVLMVLHGCHQSSEELLASTRFTDRAAEHDLVLVFPSVTSWHERRPRSTNCWGFWYPAERQRGEGEIGDLRRILSEVETDFSTDPNRQYVAGLSSGGAMAVAMAVVYGDAVRAVGSVAGLAYGETSAAVTAPKSAAPIHPWFKDLSFWRPSPSLRPMPELEGEMSAGLDSAGKSGPAPLAVLQSVNDDVVQLRNAEMLRDLWLTRSGETPTLAERSALYDGSGERSCYADRSGETILETIFYSGREDNPTHYWPGDGIDAPFADISGPSGTDVLLRFFRDHGLQTHHW